MGGFVGAKEGAVFGCKPSIFKCFEQCPVGVSVGRLAGLETDGDGMVSDSGS
jgi:hypothetical protein